MWFEVFVFGLVGLAVATVFAAVVVNWRGAVRHRKALQAVELARDRARLNPSGNKSLQQSAISSYAQQLKLDIDSLRRRALSSFVPGIFLCVGSASGPWLALSLIRSTGNL
jgi:hypothetical protein